jgi:hypothetical protein
MGLRPTPFTPEVVYPFVVNLPAFYAQQGVIFL